MRFARSTPPTRHARQPLETRRLVALSFVSIGWLADRVQKIDKTGARLKTTRRGRFARKRRWTASDEGGSLGELDEIGICENREVAWAMVASIEYIETIIDTYQKATEINLANASRQGNIVVLDAETADEVMITGDLHGNRRNFNLIRRLAALDKHPRRHLVLQEVCHGGPPYPSNGGCMSHTMLEDVAKLIVQFSGRVHFLLGNHELSEATDYGIQKNRLMLNMLFRLGMQEMFGLAFDKVREAMIPFIKSCPLAVRLPERVFISHSIPENCDTQRFNKTVFDRDLDVLDFLTDGDAFNLVWGRDYRQENADAFAQGVDADVLINGHEPCAEGYGTPNRTQVILDCCAEKAYYVILPLGRTWTQAEVLERLRKLG
jgi:hypothetical protein